MTAPLPHLSGNGHAVVTAPLVFSMDGDIDLFHSPVSLVAYCELDYLEDRHYEIFDGSGRLLFAKRVGRTYAIHIESDLPVYQVELRLLLIKFLSWRNPNTIKEALFRMSLEELLAATNQITPVK